MYHEDTIFREFQYFIKRIKKAEAGEALDDNNTIEDLEQRFRKQIESGLVIINPESQETAIEILLSDLSEKQQREYLFELRQTGKTSFRPTKETTKKKNISQNKEEILERILDIMIKVLNKSGIKARKQPLGMKLLQAAHEINIVDYSDIGDIKLLFVQTIKISGHAKKANPGILARDFNNAIKNW